MPAVYKVDECLDIFGLLHENEGVPSRKTIGITGHSHSVDRRELLAEILNFSNACIIGQVHEVDPFAKLSRLFPWCYLTLGQEGCHFTDEIVNSSIVKLFNC